MKKTFKLSIVSCCSFHEIKPKKKQKERTRQKSNQKKAKKERQEGRKKEKKKGETEKEEMKRGEAKKRLRRNKGRHSIISTKIRFLGGKAVFLLKAKKGKKKKTKQQRRV